MLKATELNNDISTLVFRDANDDPVSTTTRTSQSTKGKLLPETIFPFSSFPTEHYFS